MKTTIRTPYEGLSARISKRREDLTVLMPPEPAGAPITGSYQIVRHAEERHSVFHAGIELVEVSHMECLVFRVGPRLRKALRIRDDDYLDEHDNHLRRELEAAFGEPIKIAFAAVVMMTGRSLPGS